MWTEMSQGSALLYGQVIDPKPLEARFNSTGGSKVKVL